MKVINSKLAAIGLAAFVFASCSDGSTDNGGNTPGSVVDNTTLDLENLTSNVVNYKNSTANARKFFATRAANDAAFETSFTMPELNKGTATELFGGENLEEGKTYYVQKGTYDFSNKKLKGATLFINGDAKVTYNGTEGGMTFVIAKGGSLTFSGTGNMLNATDKVYNELGYFKTKETNQDIVIAGQLYSTWRGITSGVDENGNKVEPKELKSGLGQVENKVNPLQKITFKAGSKACIIGSIRATDLTIENGANVYASANIMNATNVNIAGNLEFGGFLKAADLTLNNGGYIKAEEHTGIKVTNALTMNAGSQIDANYINVTCNEKDSQKKVTKVGNAQLVLNGACKINIADKGVINVNKLVTDNAALGQISLNTEKALAVIKADEFHNNGDENIQAFATPALNATYLFQFTKCFQGDAELATAEDLDVAASYLDYDKATTGDVVELDDQDNTKYAYTLTKSFEDLTIKPKLDLFSAEGVEPTTISATSIQAANNKLYVTYHTHGNYVSGTETSKSFAGGLEVAHIDNNQLIIDQKVKATAGVDVNYGMIADNRFYVAGTTKAEGTFLGYVPLTDGVMASSELTTYPINKATTNGEDANWVAKYKDNYVLATNKGYHVYNSTFTSRTPHLTSADVKSLAVNGDNLYSLEATGTTTGTINIFDNINLENPTTTTTTGNVGVADGKNTIAFDGSNLYVCQGDGGLVRYDANGANGVVLFDAPKGTNGNVIGRCNGVAVDNNYIYLACGGYGLVVLDKNGAKGTNVVARRRAYTYVEDGKTVYNSANYVTVDPNGYICVAYGKSRVQIFKLTNTQK